MRSNILLALAVGLGLTASPTAAVPAPAPEAASAEDAALTTRATHSYDIVIYGNTVAAIAAAVQAKRMKAKAAIVFPQDHLGGLTASGLGWTDSKDGSTIGGIAREFYGKIYDYYLNDDHWEYGTRNEYKKANGGTSQPGPMIQESDEVQWTFEPKVARYILEKWIKDAKVDVFRNQQIDRSIGGVSKEGAHIKSFKTESGAVFQAKIFIDAGYEGDLMEAAGIPYHVGREARAEYGESAAGFYPSGKKTLDLVSPYKKENHSSSGLIFGVSRSISDADPLKGKGDSRLQSYNYRLPLTKEFANRVPFSKPDDYDEDDFEILFRYIEAGYTGPFFTSQLMPNKKTDSNANGQVSTDLIGGNYDDGSNYAEWSYDKRKECDQRHKTWTQGLLWTLSHHSRVPLSIRLDVGAWGYAADEFPDNDHWPYQLYMREGRRMRGNYIMTQSDIQSPVDPASDDDDSTAAVAHYTLDVHQVERIAFEDGIRDEGLVHVPISGPFYVPYNAIIPKAEDATNFINPVTMSSTHIAYSSIRMEPTYMTMGQTAATAAVLAIRQGKSVQKVDRETLTKTLKDDEMVLSLGGKSSRGASRMSLKVRGLAAAFSMIWSIF